MMNTATTANRNDEVVVQIFDKPTTTVINIPADVIIEIMSRLPARSIGRLRCLSKSWLSISSSHNFIKSYSQRSTNHNSIIIKRKNRTKFHFASINSNATSGFFLHKPTKKQRILNTIVEASWNGFLLLRNPESGHHSLFNPLTSQFINLPNNCRFNSSRYLYLYLHRPTSKHRLIRLYFVENLRESEVLVVGQSNWRFINSRIPDVQYHSHPVEFAGRLYWLASNQENMRISFSRDLESIPNTIMTFDTVTETYNLLPLPPIKKTRNLGGNLVDFHGELGLWNIGRHFLDLWIMERKCNWVKKYSVDFLNVSSVRDKLSFQILATEPWPVGVAVPDGDEELLIDLSADTNRCLLWVNMKHGTSRVDSWSGCGQPNLSFPYVESLAHIVCHYSSQTKPPPEPCEDCIFFILGCLLFFSFLYSLFHLLFL